MITRSANKRDASLNHESIEIEQLCNKQIKNAKTTMTNTNQQEIQTDPQPSFQAPIFNIHIHVPPYEGKDLQMYLPRIQPVIHLHFDEIARKLEINRGENEESTYRMFQNLIAMTSPKFGDVKFHYNDRSEKRNYNKSDIGRTSLSSTKNFHADCDLHDVTENSANTVPNNSDIINWYEGHSSINNSVKSPEKNVNQRNGNPRKRTISRSLEKDVKLKKAVVVLTDICKSKYYENLVAGSATTSATITDVNVTTETSCNQKEDFDNLSGRVDSEGEENNGYSISQEYEKFSIKSENDSPISESPGSVKKIEMSPWKTIPESNELNSGSDKCEIDRSSVVTKSLTSLAEGCNFSEILHRFRIKESGEHLGDSVENFSDARTENFIENNEEEDYYNCEKSEQDSYQESKLIINEGNPEESQNVSGNFEIETNVEDFDAEVNFLSISNENLKEHFQEASDCKDIEVQSENFHNSCDPGSDIEDYSIIDEIEEHKEEEVEEEDKEEEEEEEDAVSNNDGDEEKEDEYNNDELSKLHSMQRIIRTTTDSEIEILSCSTSPYLIPVHRFKFIESNESSSNKCDWSTDLQLELIKKEMARRRMNNSNGNNKNKSGKVLKKKASEVKSSLESSSQAKKMKRSNGQDTENSSRMDDYIPLQASGPTRFAVAPLNEVIPYKSHSAKNFKNEMLFGNRVNRFSTSDHLRIFRMKKNSARKMSE